jgi:hypothetical protein
MQMLVLYCSQEIGILDIEGCEVGCYSVRLLIVGRGICYEATQMDVPLLLWE